MARKIANLVYGLGKWRQNPLGCSELADGSNLLTNFIVIYRTVIICLDSIIIN